MIVAKTIKGKGDPEVEDKNGFHGKALDHSDEVIATLGGVRNLEGRRGEAGEGGAKHEFPGGTLELPRYELGTEVATRKAYGDALAALGKARGDVVALDGEVSNSTFADEFRDAIPDRYFEMYIAEQQMVATAVGMQVLGWRPFASTFAAFLSRAYDFIRMSAISRANYCLCGSHAGVSIGEDGPSQMALEDIAALRAVHGSTVLHPCDANQTAKLVAQMADTEGIVYLRTLRPATPVIYGPDEEFEIGGSRTLREGDDVAIVGAGITVHEALKAADALAQEGIEARVIDLYSIKPLDAETLRSLTCPIVTVEDHWAEGGLGEAVLSALGGPDERPPVVRLAVREMPHSGKPAELLAEAGIDADGIAAAARKASLPRSGRRRAAAAPRGRRGRPRPALRAARRHAERGVRDLVPERARARARPRRGARPPARRRRGSAARARRPSSGSSRGREQPAAGRDDLAHLRQEVGDRGEAERDALVGGLAQVERRRLEREAGDRAARVRVPAGRALAAEKGQEDEPVVARVALRERSRASASVRSSHA